MSFLIIHFPFFIPRGRLRTLPMKHFSLLIVLAYTSSFAQVLDPARWTVEKPKKEVKIGDVVEISINGTLAKDWYIYSTEFEAEGPNRTVFNFKPNPTYQLVGKVKPVGFHEKYEEVWEGKVSIAENKAKFVQKIKILQANPVIEGTYEYSVCSTVSGQCLPVKENEFKIDGFNIEGQRTNSKGQIANSKEQIADSKGQITNSKEQIANSNPTTQQPNNSTTQQLNNPTTQQLNNSTTQQLNNSTTPPQSLWSFLALAFLAGMASIFMPCIYPIMPMTVSFFTKQTNGTQKATFYGFSIMFIFGLIGLVTMAFGAPFLNFISTHWLPNLIFFVIFILFGVSLLGAFEIALPNDTVNKIDQLSERGGLIGIFFMALTLVVVSFSCTVPFVGSLLILAAQGEVLRPLYGMLAFGLPFAVVFTSLAMFPQWLKNLPKSGGWLGEMKVVFGLLEFALALKFLSNIDLAYHWDLLHRNIFLVLWIVIFTVVGLYILGLMRLPKDAKVHKYNATRLGFAALTFAFVLYMIPGVANKPLPLLAGILPPLEATAPAATANSKLRGLPHQLQGFYDLDDALTEAKKTQKPVFIDFTGYACANCRKMEEYVWPDAKVLKRLKNDFVIASLYVDDKTELPREKHYVSTYDQKTKTTIGAKNADLQIVKFNNNAQPYYCLVTPAGELIIPPVGYSSTEDFVAFLDKGLTNFKKPLAISH